MEGKQTGDPAKLARTLLTLTAMTEPPVRLPAGDDAVEGITAKANLLIRQASAHPELSTGLDLD